MLSIRTPREDESYMKAPDHRLPESDRIELDRSWFELNNQPGTGLARVMTLTTHVETPNIYRGTDGGSEETQFDPRRCIDRDRCPLVSTRSGHDGDAIGHSEYEWLR